MVTETCQFLVESRADHVPVHARHSVRIDSQNENGRHVREDDQPPSLVPEVQHSCVSTEAAARVDGHLGNYVKLALGNGNYVIGHRSSR